MQLEIIRMIQRFSNPALDSMMECVTILGEQMVLTAVFCAVYWCVDKRLGRFLVLSLGLTVCVNGVVKDIFRVERLFGQPGIVSHRVETATGYSFPSGHTQTSTTFWGGILIYIKKPLVRILLAVLILGIGFSRMYLGVHYPSDVLGGLLFGALVSAVMYYVIIIRESRALTLAVCLAAVAAALLTGSSDDTFAAAGLLLGILCGTVFEEKLVRFEITQKTLMQKGLRYFAGMAFIGIAYLAPRAVLPETLVMDAMIYAFVVFCATGLYPLVFTKLRF